MRDRYPQKIKLPVTFEAKEDHVVAIFDINGSTLGIHFTSPEHLLEFFYELIEKAAIVWPGNEWIQEYLREEPDGTDRFSTN